jgi:DNA polymerase sigma
LNLFNNNNLNLFNNYFYQNNYQTYNSIFYSYWSDENNLLSNLRKNTNNNKSNYHNKMTYIKYKSDNLFNEYIKIQKVEKDNPSIIEENLKLFEEKIMLPVYAKINEENQEKKDYYTEIYNKYKNIIVKILSKYGLEDTLVEPYGSIVNNFMTEWGDMDICIVPKDFNSLNNFSEYLNEIKEEAVDIQKVAKFNILEKYQRFLILKLVDIEKNIDLDITVQNILPIQNTKLIRLYSLLDQRFHILGIFLKFWVKKNHIHGAPEKFLSSYALLILIIHYLQNIAEPKILPILQEIQKTQIEYTYYFEDKEIKTNLYFEENLDKINNYMNIINNKSENNNSVVELLIGFFHFYAYEYKHYLISISHSDKKQVAEDNTVAFPLEDPFDINYNPGKSLKLNTLQYIAFIYCLKKELNNILSGEYFKFGVGE